jgi:hypothetical protein
MRSQFGTGPSTDGQSDEMHHSFSVAIDLRFSIDSKAQGACLPAPDVSADAAVFTRAANWRSECFHQAGTL